MIKAIYRRFFPESDSTILPEHLSDTLRYHERKQPKDTPIISSFAKPGEPPTVEVSDRPNYI